MWEVIVLFVAFFGSIAVLVDIFVYYASSVWAEQEAEMREYKRLGRERAREQQKRES